MNSSSYAHGDHLRHLLDQRSARADINDRFSSVSEYSDTPSVYSHRFSPTPQDREDRDFSVRSLNVDTSRRHPFSSEPRSPMSDRDLLSDPSASGLDLDGDYRSSYASSNTYDDSNEQPLSPADVGEDTRMSMLGPKVRIHGRAPWEMGEDTLEEGDESDSSGRSYAFSTKRAKVKGESITKGFGRGAPSPRPTLASRPSDESNRSRSRSKGSFETTASSISNSQGALQALAQASISSTSLSLPSSEPSGKGSGLRNKFSMPRVRSRIDSRAKSPLPPSPRSTVFSESPTTSEFSRTSSASSPRPSISAQVNPDFVHPYANPDLVVSYASDSTPSFPNHGAFGNISRSDSISTITDVHSVSSHSTLRHMASASSLRQASLPTPRASNLTGKGISSPINTLRSNDLSPNNPPKIKEPQVMARPPPLGPNGIPGWMDNPGSPTIQLISLEEAQAQAKERARSATVNSSVSNQATPFPEPMEKAQSPTNSMRSRTRSISAGAKARSALSNIVGPPTGPDRRDSEPSVGTSGVPGKSLKHKKSGFMRIFNGKERDAVPPVPILADEYAVHNSQPSSIPKTPKISLSRVPVPPLGPSTMQESPSSSSFLSDVSNSSISMPGHHMNLSAKRAPPALQIHTSSLPSCTPATGNLTLPIPTPVDKSDEDGEAPRSAPPSTSDFPSLSLRPVSTIFSAHFADHIVAPGVGSLAEEERTADTPSSISPATGRSPMTPGFPLRSDGSTGDKSSIAVVGSEDQSSVIQALQEQIVSARKAWQRHIWELEGQVRDLKAEVDDLRTAGDEKGYCEICGRGKAVEDGHTITKKVGVVNRPRARTGDVARFANGN